MDTIKSSRYHAYHEVACPVEASLELIGGKGKGLILYHLLAGTLRFNELKKQLSWITGRVLTRQLRELEHFGLVSRKVYAQVPPKVEYSLTPEGESLRPLILLLRDWGNTYGLKLLGKEADTLHQEG